MEDIKDKVKIDINDIAMGVYGFLLKKKLLTPDEYHILRSQKISKEEIEENKQDASK